LIKKISQHHPSALPVLFFAELWERFSYYGMQALLVLFMVSELAFSDKHSYGIFAAYATLVYITPMLGGVLADRYIGCRKAITLGAIIMAMGHFCLAITGDFTFYIGLALLICGNGFFKPNISSLLGQLYEHGDPRRDAGFTIFYMGINIGAFFAPLACGFLGEVYGWHYGFGLAGFGMLIGLLIFQNFAYKIGDHGHPPNPQKLTKRRFGLTVLNRIYLGLAILIPFFAFVVSNPGILDSIMPYVLGSLLCGLLILAYQSESHERSNVITILVLMFFHSCFWAFMFQMASSINLYTSRNVDRMLGGFELPTTWFQALNPIFIVMLAPIFSTVWVYLGRKNLDPYPPMKFTLGLLMLSLGFAILAFGSSIVDQNGLSPMYWVITAYFVQTAGEVCIAPVGLSMVSKLAPERFSSVFMGIWFIGLSCAQYLAGVIARFTSVNSNAGGKIDKLASSLVYGEVFTKIAIAAAGIALLLLVISPFMRSVFNYEDHGTDEDLNDDDEILEEEMEEKTAS
jgi:proton-dependent oligopeptide transporter, POT family